MVENDLISVLIPAYNVQKYLGRCLRSVLKQTYQNLEIVVVDDGSTDRTYAVAKKYADRDARIVLLQKENEKNVAKTRNYLLEHCRGKYCVWVDSDDQVQPGYVEKLYRALTMSQADMSICRFVIRAFPFPIMPPVHMVKSEYSGDAIVQQIFYKRGFVLWNKMYRMDLIRTHETLRFDPNYSYGEDLLFNLRYLQYCQKIVCLNHKLYRYSWRAGSEVHKKFSDNQIKFMDRLLKLCQQEPNPVVLDTLRGWAAFSCCGAVFLMDKRRYPDAVARMRYFAYEYRNYLYKNHLAKFIFKFILWLGLKTWCRQKKIHKLQLKENKGI